MSAPPALRPLCIVSVSSPLASSTRPLKEGVGLLLTLPLSGLMIVTVVGAAMAVPTGPAAIVTSETTVARKRTLAVLLIESCSQPCHVVPPSSRQVIEYQDPARCQA